MSKKLKGWKFIVLSLGLVGATFLAQAQGHEGEPSQSPPSGEGQGEASAPANCGVLGVCQGGEKVFMYSCQGDNVVVRLCGKGTIYKIEDQKHCPGPERKIDKTDFRNFINAQLDKTELQDKLGAITRDDIKASRSSGNLSEAKSCQEKLEGQIANLENQLAQLGDAMDATVKARIQKQIDGLRTNDLVKAKANVAACTNKDAAIAKINSQIDEAVNKICSKNGIHVPKSGEFLHTVLSQYDPSKLPCSSEKDCAQEVRNQQGRLLGAVVRRTVNAEGVVEEFIKDRSSNLIWSPEAPKTMTHQEAINYCAAKNDLGLKWSLPSKKEFRVAFNPFNPGKEKFAYNKVLLEALDTKNRFLWSSSVTEDDTHYAWCFNGNDGDSFGYLVYGYRNYQESVRCVGR